MKRCSHCERSISFWSFRCQVCKNSNWRVPQIIFLALACLGILGGGIAAIDYFAYSKQSPAPAVKPAGQDNYHPQYSVPVSEPPAGAGRRRRDR